MKAPAGGSRDSRGGRDSGSPTGRNQHATRGVNRAWTHLSLRAPAHEEAAALAERAAKSGGRPLEPNTRAAAEQRLGHDFGDVRIHTDDRAATAATAIDAHAYTVGRDIVFGKGEYDTGSERGRRLIGHELAHVAQQHGAPGTSPISPRIQRQPRKSGKTYQCTAVSLRGSTLTFSGNYGSAVVTATRADVAAGSYLVQLSKQHPGALEIRATGQALGDTQVLSFTWSMKGDQAVINAFAEKVNGYVASLTSPVPMTVSATSPQGSSSGVQVIDEGGPATGSGSGTEAGKGGKQQTSSTGGKGGETGTGTKKGGTGTTESGSGTKTGETGSGGTGGTQGQQVDAAYKEKLEKLMDGPVEKTLDANEMRELQQVLDQLSLDDIALFKRSSIKKSGDDLKGVLQSLKLFASTKELYEKADKEGKLQKPEISDEALKILAEAKKQYADNMSADAKERLARATIETLSNQQLKNLTAAQIAEGLVRVDKQIIGAGDEMSKGLDQALNDRGWGQVAGVARGVKGAAGFWGILAMGAMLVAAFVPGLNVVVLGANALAAGMVVFAAATIQQEAEIQAARNAKSADEIEQRIKNGAQARTEKIMAGVALALPIAAKYLGKLPVPQAINKVRIAVGKARVAIKGGGANLAAAKTSLLAELQQAHADLQPAIADYRTSIAQLTKRIREVKGADLVRELQSAPELADLISAETAKGLEKLGPKDLEIARAGILEALDNAPAVAEQTMKALEAEVSALEAKVQAATSSQELTQALQHGEKVTAPEHLRDVGQQAGAEVVKARVEAETRAPKPASEPVKPTPTTKATDPVKPTQPTTATAPVKPKKPPKPVEPEKPVEPDQPAKPAPKPKAVKIDPQQGVKDAIARTQENIDASKKWVADQAPKRTSAAEAVRKWREKLETMAANDPERPSVAKKLEAAQDGLAEQNRQYEAEGRRLSDFYDTLKRLKDALNKKTYDRPGFTEAERATVWKAAAAQNKEGKVFSPSGKEIKPGDPSWEMGHKPGWEHWKHVESAAKRGLTRDQFLRECKELDRYRPETPEDNASHAFEDKTDRYLGKK